MAEIAGIVKACRVVVCTRALTLTHGKLFIAHNTYTPVSFTIFTACMHACACVRFHHCFDLSSSKVMLNRWESNNITNIAVFSPPYSIFRSAPLPSLCL